MSLYKSKDVALALLKAIFDRVTQIFAHFTDERTITVASANVTNSNVVIAAANLRKIQFWAVDTTGGAVTLTIDGSATSLPSTFCDAIIIEVGEHETFPGDVTLTAPSGSTLGYYSEHWS